MTSDFYTREEVTILLDTCRKHFPQAYAFVLVLVRAGPAHRRSGSLAMGRR